ncbi:aspartyl/glutamyl-tRNA amidotransferase subunit A [Candidatus Pacearchaeota archaeon]|nr:aspartyl/glutamyl-tRNA amidotransferase subunit A [Candidatus Pacearchaeota archaeon]
MALKEKIYKIKRRELSAERNIRDFLKKIQDDNIRINAVLHINPDAVEQARIVDEKIKNGCAGKLAGIGFIVKSNINVKGLICNCASRTLENYRATYDASVIKKLLKEDAIVLGMANMDEFAAGGSGESSAFGITKNPAAIDRIAGGSSSGSAASVAAGFCDFALGSDTGGSIRNPASHCGVIGLKPSYGAVSRYGLIDLSMSLDVIGPLANSVEDCELIFDIIKGKDERDAVSMEWIANNDSTNHQVVIGIPEIGANKEKASSFSYENEEIWELVKQKVKLVANKNKWKIEECRLKHLDLGIQTYYPINYVEFFSGTRKFDGRKYGYKIEDSCGEEVLRRILGGREISKAEFAGKYYRRALKAKKIIEKEFEEAFEKYEVLAMPTVPRLPHKFGEQISIEDMYNYDTLTVLANLAEIPGISVPCGKINGIPVGLQILAKKGADNFLLEVAKRFE